MKAKFISTLIITCLLLSSCVAISQRKFWTYRKLKSETTTTPNVGYVEINLFKDNFLIPTPIIMTQINVSKYYLLNIDCITDSVKEYRSLDSIRYNIINPTKNMLSEGVLPIKNGEFSIRSYSYGKYRAQCTTDPKIKLSKQKQSLVGTFTIYATDSIGQLKTIGIDNVKLHYRKPRIVGLW